MKRKLIKSVAILSVISLVFSIVSFLFIAGAETISSQGKCGENVNFTLDETTGELRIYGTGEMDNYESLSWLEPFLHAPWHADSELVKSIVIEDGVTSIGDCAFYNCENMINVVIPQSVKKIGWGAFSYCSSLENIVIPEGVETVAEDVFYECNDLKTVSIPKSVTDMPASALYGCDSLESITVDSENPNYYSDEFGVLFNKNKTVLLRYPSGNTRTSYSIPESVVTVYGSSFASSKNLKDIAFPDGLKTIRGDAFMGCDSLTELNLPGSLETIGIYAFAYCTALKTLTIPDETKTIGTNAFVHCEALESIILPDSLKRISSYVFEETAFFDNESNWENGALYCGKYLIAVKQDYTGELVIKPGTRMIADFALDRCKKLTEVTMSDSLEIIGEGAFNICEKLENAVIPESVTTLIGSTFRFCDSLVNVTIPETVTSVGDQVFYQCENLESVEIKAKIPTIGRSMFYGCPKLTNVILPDTITKIDVGAFNDCDSLETLVLPEGLEVIEEGAFSASQKLTDVNLPESLTKIGYEAFSSTNINNITIPANVTSIGERAFANTANLSNFAVDENNSSFMYDGKALYTKDKSRLICYFIANDDKIYVVENELQTIDRNAFIGNAHLERITIPDSVTDMDTAFGGCTNLRSAAIGEGVSTLHTYSFRNCSSLEKVYIPDSLTEIIYYAFSGCKNIKDVYYSGTQEEWAEIKGLSYVSEFKNATVHYNHVHSHSLDAGNEEIYNKYGYRLYSCECGHYYAEYELNFKSDKYDVSIVYHPDCFSEEVTFGVEYVSDGVYKIKAVNKNGEAVQPNDGYSVRLKMSVPETYADKTDLIINHRLDNGSEKKLSVSDGTLVIENGYMIFKVEQLGEFEISDGDTTETTKPTEAPTTIPATTENSTTESTENPTTKPSSTEIATTEPTSAATIPVTTKPIEESTTKPDVTVPSTTQPITETEPVTEPSSKEESTTQPATESSTEPATEPSTEPSTEPDDNIGVLAWLVNMLKKIIDFIIKIFVMIGC